MSSHFYVLLIYSPYSIIKRKVLIESYKLTINPHEFIFLNDKINTDSSLIFKNNRETPYIIKIESEKINVFSYQELFENNQFNFVMQKVKK